MGQQTRFEQSQSSLTLVYVLKMFWVGVSVITYPYPKQFERLN